MAQHPLRGSTVRIETASGSSFGTGFVAAACGKVITCHHVICDSKDITIIYPCGHRCEAVWCSKDDEILSANDVAIIRPVKACDQVFTPLPIECFALSPEFETRVQLRAKQAFLESVPLSGSVTGRMNIKYQVLNRDYEVEGVLISGVEVIAGMSGAPVWDDEHQCVTGLIGVSSASTPNIDGYVVP